MRFIKELIMLFRWLCIFVAGVSFIGVLYHPVGMTPDEMFHGKVGLAMVTATFLLIAWLTKAPWSKSG